MKATYQLALLAATLAVAGCQDSRYEDRDLADNSTTVETDRERREGLNNPNVDKNAVPDSPRLLNPDYSVTPPYPEVPDYNDRLDPNKIFRGETQDDFVASTDRRLKDLDAEIAALGERIETLNADPEARDALNSLREKQDALNGRFRELKAASNDAWMEMKTGFESSLDELSRAFDDAKAKFDK